ncbi:hypothetical protein BH11PAT3_BH11PAT3_0160 [soil metagenome]
METNTKARKVFYGSILYSFAIVAINYLLHARILILPNKLTQILFVVFGGIWCLVLIPAAFISGVILLKGRESDLSTKTIILYGIVIFILLGVAYVMYSSTTTPGFLG